MTGEMSWIKPNGDAGDGNSYPVHAIVARRMRCKLRPFDTYIGPYIAHKAGTVFLSTEDGFTGQAVLWPGGVAPAYCPSVVVEYAPFNDAEAALIAVRQAVKARP